MERPDGVRLLSLLIDLYADQEGIKVKYEIDERRKSSERNQSND